MNAYELADELLRDNTQLTVKAANMLRQQADRIAELEKFNKAILKKGGYPHKPLSDEEIHELANEYLRTQNQDGCLVVLGMEDFARAIEERHGIK